MPNNEKSVPAEGVDYGDTMIVWPSKSKLPGGNPADGSPFPPSSLGPGWSDYGLGGVPSWFGPYISIHFLSLNPLLVRHRRYSRGERYPSALCGCHSL